ncbi:ABC transporter ATP-binding protein/permease [Candidatus Stoquefichus sp. SB1]|uniref:ABC transporter ATP-binding protein/permease n=1 Tax=Candidatus Stoquefichus sp. SB1 TaxID=1658109 RepID=UPI00067EB09E|nr:ABC transporter ATP-binding protein/permease [Candidatus Stoquefichus sp. SB1]
MFDKRLIKEIPATKPFVMKQVLCLWIALLMNIIFTMGLCFMFVELLTAKFKVIYFIYAFLIAAILFVIRAFVLKKATLYAYQGARLVKENLRQRLFEKVINIGIHYQDYVSTSELVQLSVEGINQLETYFALYLPQLFYSVLAPVTLFVVISGYDFLSALVLFICVPIIPISIVCVQKFAKKLLSKYWKSYTTLGDSFLENLQGLTTLKIYQSDGYKQQQMNEEAENFRKVTMRVLIMQLNSISIMDIVAYGGAGLGSYLAIHHYMNQLVGLFGTLLIILLSFEFFIPLRQLGSFFHIAMNGMAASDKIFKVLDIENKHHGEHHLHANDLSIMIQNLSFQYDSKRPILQDISFEIKPNQFIGIVGESGSGKSTIAKLIMGYHQNYQGVLKIQDYQRYDIKDNDFAKRVTYITHEPMIFKGTLRENIDFYHRYQDDEIFSVLKQVCLDEYFLQQNGLDTTLLEAGSNLSGGQKQRLNLARALLADSDMYIFDEATSNIDVESEENILSVIEKLSQTKTIIMITHRLSTVERCDEILVMKDGQLIEKGTHHELGKQKGLYYQLLNQQKALEVYQ